MMLHKIAVILPLCSLAPAAPLFGADMLRQAAGNRLLIGCAVATGVKVPITELDVDLLPRDGSGADLAQVAKGRIHTPMRFRPSSNRSWRNATGKSLPSSCVILR